MVRFLIQVAVNLATAIVALTVAGLVIDDVVVRPVGLATAVVVFVLANALFTPLIFKMARKYAPAVLGGVGLLSTLVALLIATAFGNGLTITGFMAWVLATLLVWAITTLGGWAMMAWWAKKHGRSRGTAARS